MKQNKEILDEFGKWMVNECFDGTLNQIIKLRELENPPPIFKEKVDFLKSLNKEQFTNLKKNVRDNFEVSFHEFFKLFEENENYKIIYDNGNSIINLSEISEMLKAEHLIENGWIDRFSKFGSETK